MQKREITYLSLHCHAQNDFCIKVGSNENHINVSLIMSDKVTRQCPQTTTIEEKGEPKWIRSVVPLITSLTPYRCAKPAHEITPKQYSSLFPLLVPSSRCLSVWPINIGPMTSAYFESEPRNLSTNGIDGLPTAAQCGRTSN